MPNSFRSEHYSQCCSSSSLYSNYDLFHRHLRHPRHCKESWTSVLAMFSIVMFGFKTNNECYFNVSCLEMLDKKGTGTVSELEYGVARPVYSLSLGWPSVRPRCLDTILSYLHLQGQDLNVNHKTCQHENIQNLKNLIDHFPVLRATNTSGCQLIQRIQ